MTAEGGGFLQQAWCDGQLRLCILWLIGLLLAFAGTAALLQRANVWLDRLLEDIRIEAEPLCRLYMSPDSELRAYGGRLSLFRHGTCIAEIGGGVRSVVIGGTKADRTLELEYARGVQAVRCGYAGWQEAKKAATMILKYAGKGQDDG